MDEAHGVGQRVSKERGDRVGSRVAGDGKGLRIEPNRVDIHERDLEVVGQPEGALRIGPVDYQQLEFSPSVEQVLRLCVGEHSFTCLK